MEKERIQKIMSALGICSRRKAEKYIEEGLVYVNGVKVTEQGFKCYPSDEITLDGKIVNRSSDELKPVYLALNKPYDYVSTASDPQGRKTVVDLIPPEFGRVFPVGRLDHNSTGLLIMTNDGEFANLVTHPSSAPEKEYLVKVKNPLKGDEIEKLAKGLYITREGYKAAPCTAKVVKEDEESVVFSIILREGKKREIRHMMETLDHPVKFLMRIRIGTIMLGKIPEGHFREIPLEEIEKIKTQCRYDKEHNTYGIKAEEDIEEEQ